MGFLRMLLGYIDLQMDKWMDGLANFTKTIRCNEVLLCNLSEHYGPIIL